MKPIRLLLVDDHRLLTDAWEMIFSTDRRFLVVATAADARSALAATERCRPDVALVDINMTPIDGIELTRMLKHCMPPPKIIGVSCHCSTPFAKRILKAGASGYITKNTSRAEFMNGICEVAQGHTFICREIMDQLATDKIPAITEQGYDPDALSRRQMQVVGLLQQGLSSREIGMQLGVTTRTIEVHRYHILQRTGMPNTAALINLFSSQGW